MEETFGRETWESYLTWCRERRSHPYGTTMSDRHSNRCSPSCKCAFAGLHFFVARATTHE